MKTSKRLICLLALLAGVGFSGLATAAHSGHAGGHIGGTHGGYGHGHGGYGHRGGFVWGGVYAGGPWFWGTYDAWPLYDGYLSAPGAAVPMVAPAYIEQDQGSPQQGAAIWYYCENPPGYYPYVQSCAAGWQRVQPQLPPGGF